MEETYDLCKPTYEIIRDQFKDGDILIPFDSSKKCEIRSFQYMAGDGYAMTKRYKTVKVYDSRTGQLAPKVGFGEDLDAKHMEQTRRFVEGMQSTGLSARDYLNKSIRR